MEYIKENLIDRINITSFSEIICEKWSIDSDIITNYIFANISLCIAKNRNMKKEIDKIYMHDQLKYYNAITNSKCIEHVIIKQGTLEHELYARRVLAILLEAEYDNSLRSKLIKLLRKYYPIIYTTVKKRNKEKLKNKYMKMDIVTRNLEAKFDAAIYLYFAVYISAEAVDHGFVMSILNDIEDFEFESLMNQNIENELEKYKTEIQEIKVLIKREYGKIFSYKDIIRHNNENISNFGYFFEDLLATNKININHIFSEYEFANIDKTILSYIRVTKNRNMDLIVSSIISGIFIQPLINEYKNAKKICVENNNEVIQCELNLVEDKLNYVLNENNNLKTKIEELNKEKLLYEKNLNQQLHSLNNIHKQEIERLGNNLKELENKLNQEKSLRLEIESLREYELNLNGDCDNGYLDKNLYDYIQNKKIIIIGGDKEWRRKFRIKYPEIRTLNGFNENFDISTLNNSDYIFFYTKYMNHSTFYKAMNYIKFNECKFGYIGKTNINLVEQEIIDNISKY
ncbi:hypothetical protein CLPUN_36420 [Clostridium puniceum]|uniref:Uncharacterized protein n=1 Tax=Clostridium puniceum TaxID=29367 RepID=A0A1S8TB28_9CLOT|nr:hypothetical protein [Clostridium puniceum]OOM74814.1 hypothetical protein CLPUN_36420 [Clostridium puniceum]